MNDIPGYNLLFSICQALTEAHRVLVPGGRFLCMEFSPIQNPLVKTYVTCNSV